MKRIDIPNAGDSPEIEIVTELEGREYSLRFLYSERRERWSVDLRASQSETAIFLGRTVVLAMPIVPRIPHPLALAGALIFLPSDGTFTDPKLLDLGGRVRLLYLTPAEVADLG